MDGNKTTAKGGIEKMMEEIASFTPKAGYNLVGIDDFAIPGDGESLYLLQHFDTWEEAVAAQKKIEDNENTVIYPNTKRLGEK